MSRERGRSVLPAFAPLLLALFLLAPPEAHSARVEVRKVIDTSALGDPFVFDVGPDGAVLVLTEDNIHDAGSGESLFGKPLKGPAWLSFAGRGFRLLADGALFAVDGGAPRKLLDVPLKSCVFVADGDRIYIGGVDADGKAMLFLYKEGAGFKPLLSLAAPIDAMTLARGELLFSSGSRIYALKEGGPARLFSRLPGFSHIPSLAADEANGLLYFSDGDDLFALRGADFVLVRQGIGGMLRYRKGELYVLSRREHALFRLSGLPAALSAAGSLSPLSEPCRSRELSLHCEAAKKREILRTLATMSALPSMKDTSAQEELASAVAEQKGELDRIRTRLEKEAEAGGQGVRWGGGTGPQAIRPGDAIATGKEGAGVTLWDGSEIRIGPGSKAVVGDCRPGRECRQTLENGLLYFESFPLPGDGAAAPASRESVIATGALSLHFRSARVVVHASGGRTVVAVMEGRVRAVTARGETVTVAGDETLEVKEGESPGNPRQADMKRLNKWWEEI